MSIARHLGHTKFMVVLAVALGPATVLAQAADKAPTKADRAAARQAYDLGTSAFEKGDFVAALDSFVKANALIPSVQAMYWIAQAQDRLGRTDAAIEAYEAITARADFDKLSAEKAATVRERLAALKPPPPPPAPEPAPEPAPAPVVVEPLPPPPVQEPPPPVVTLPPPVPAPSLVPKAGTVELGLLLGVMIPPSDHNLVQRRHSHHEFDGPAWQIGINAGYYPLAALGFEADWLHGIGSVKAEPGRTSGTANFDSLRAHVIGQLPDSRFVPFVLLGAGMLRGASVQNGSDRDFVFHGGAGLKVFATRWVVPRVDLRATLAQKQGGSLADGLVVYPEVLLGVGFRLGG